jgi:hypothetical protein
MSWHFAGAYTAPDYPLVYEAVRICPACQLDMVCTVTCLGPRSIRYVHRDCGTEWRIPA